MASQQTVGSFTTVLLTRGYHALIDLEDYDKVASLKWRAKVDSDGRVYAMAHFLGSGKRGKGISMHRFVMGAKPGERIDHWDGDGLHNWKSNLRRCTNQQNICNQRPHRDKKTSKLKGVYLMRSGKFRAQIMANYRKFNLGSFPDEISAAHAYDAAARKHHGEFARLNFPEAAHV